MKLEVPSLSTPDIALENLAQEVYTRLTYARTHGIPSFTNADKFVNELRPGDLVSTYGAYKDYDFGMLAKLWGKVIQLAQQMPYNSLKMVYDTKKLAGYLGELMPDGSYNTNFTIVPSRPYIASTVRTVAIRYPNITAQHVHRLQAHARKRVGLSYDARQTMLSAINRMFTRFSFGVIPDLSQTSDKELLNFIQPMFCSSILAVLYQGIIPELKFDIRNIGIIWPVDFLLSSQFEIVAFYDSE